MNQIRRFFYNELQDYRILLRNVPAMPFTFLCISVVLMNIMANKELLNIDYLALDCGFVLSWIPFLCSDMITRRFGAKASIKLSILAMLINIAVVVILFLLSLVPGNWGVYYDYSDSSGAIANLALNSTIGGTWYVVLGSMTAFAVSSIVNALVNEAIGKAYRSDENVSFGNFALRSYVSTSIGQFIDNLVFAFMVSHVFFGWSVTQCILCALTGAAAELIAEIVFSPIGYDTCRRWESQNVGQRYLEYVELERR